MNETEHDQPTTATKIVRHLLQTMQQETLAELVGCSCSNIGMISIGRRGARPSHKVMHKLEALYKKSRKAAEKSMLSKNLDRAVDGNQGDVKE